MGRRYLLTLIVIVLIGCNEETKEWVFHGKIELPEKSRPLALAKTGEEIWLSDPEHFRLLKIDLKGKVLDSIMDLKRPMNLDSDNGNLYVPEFLTDTIWVIEKGIKMPFSIKAKPDAPAGLFVKGDTIAVADFYNHRIILQLNSKVYFIGKEGHKKGELYYPTDVKIFDDRIYVADAYNNRVQIFDFSGKVLQVLGDQYGLRVASAIDLTEDYIAVTDQENSRVLIYHIDGSLFQTLNSNINYPTDVLFDGSTLYIANFKENSVSIYRKNQ
ncbi:MAG TPA: NHL repeat-containing protein [Eudoraea sp.]|nr:NHL repeat-containing protein [Eudoraea sp.]